ncbi:E3 ubiquitin-protein ligase PUB23 [Iris pallida]|uniref:U-box domain-containing protein n=1 Tax=Iris pallida TaxID=29817 RepID=A0AAX6E2P0_IRIPA|nr:E3 ubiquitin-protein ligase PUB23 [Iris pallida]
MEGVEVPSFFLCPISLQIMRDPVTLSTGITYDRHSIERWLFTDEHDTCPITQTTLTDRDLIVPNHTLRRLIQAWCVTNASERFPTPRPPVDRSHIANLLDQARSHPQSLLTSLRKLKSIVGGERQEQEVRPPVVGSRRLPGVVDREQHRRLQLLQGRGGCSCGGRSAQHPPLSSCIRTRPSRPRREERDRLRRDADHRAAAVELPISRLRNHDTQVPGAGALAGADHGTEGRALRRNGEGT